ncbi:hypothetical protein SAMN05216285_1752 [Natrinema salifodinae]|uniref:Uncharacterized protein n=1 Tax=Natrinema salifodinae TaxID=1202768 RepID=A0A1I0NIN3_9EURY|nr:hypothetical protein SAMN05216285_1752 [Natrinema salifodinae]
MIAGQTNAAIASTRRTGSPSHTRIDSRIRFRLHRRTTALATTTATARSGIDGTDGGMQ